MLAKPAKPTARPICFEVEKTFPDSFEVALNSCPQVGLASQVHGNFRELRAGQGDHRARSFVDLTTKRGFLDAFSAWELWLGD